MSDAPTDFDNVVDEVAEEIGDQDVAIPDEPAIVVDIPNPMVQIEEDEDCPFLDCIFGDQEGPHLHFTNEPQKPLVNE